MSELFKNRGVEVDIIEPDNFKKIMETLTRIGRQQRRFHHNCDPVKELEQLCHILHKTDENGNSRYAIMHFKEMFEMDNFESTKSEIDVAIRNKVARLLEEWNLVKIVNEQQDLGNIATIDQFTVIPFKDKNNWALKTMYTMQVR